MKPPPTDAERFAASQRLLEHYARAVAAFMALQRAVYVEGYREKADQLIRQEQEVYELTLMHLGLPLPSSPATH